MWLCVADLGVVLWVLWGPGGWVWLCVADLGVVLWLLWGHVDALLQALEEGCAECCSVWGGGLTGQGGLPICGQC